MATMFNPEKERLVQVASGSIRVPGGEISPSEPMYMIVPIDAVHPHTGLALSEMEAFDDIAAVLAPMFKQYVDGVDEINKQRERAGALV